MKIYNSSKGYTLAEVLMTLVILGVIAMITVPSTVSRVQRNHFITKYKKTYAALNAAFEDWAIETNYTKPHLGGNDPECLNWNNGKCTPGLAPMLRARLKTSGSKSIYDTANPYKGSNSIKNLDGTNNTFVYGQSTIILNDGVQINMATGHPHLVCENSNCKNWTGDYTAAFFIDVNGDNKGPNTIGKDIFVLIGLHDGLYTWPLPEKFQKQQPFYVTFTKQMRESDYWAKCTKNSSGFACSSWFLNHNDYDK